MTDSEKQEKCRIIAEILGFLKPTKDEAEEALRDRRCELRRWTLHRHNNAPIENFSSYYWTCPDFYTDEAANAMVLEALNPSVELIRFDDGTWSCGSPRTMSGANDCRNKDRKTAICEAFLKMLEK